MQDKIFEYLKSRKEGVSSSELVDQVLKIKGTQPAICDKLIQTAVSGDRRFAVNEHNCWKISVKDSASFTEAEIVFLSLLTVDTVGKPRAIIEISAQKLECGKITGRLHVLIKPDSQGMPTAPLSPDIREEMKEGTSAEKAVRSLFRFIGESVLVGYDVHTSIHQLNAILHKSNEHIENSSVCLKYLARKLIPDLRPKSLDDVASFFKIPVLDIRRTEKEVCVMAEIFSLYKELLKEQGVNTREDLLEFQYADINYIDFNKYSFDKGFLLSIPQKPGVYRMKNNCGEVVYVGKAKNLKTRISSYFWNTTDRSQKINQLLDTIYSIEYETTGSELAAALLEFRLIKQYRPKLNQQIEVHERSARYGNLRNFIVILPALMEKSLELFFVKEGNPLERYEILRNAVNFSEVERILTKMYYETSGANGRSPHEKGNGGIQHQNGLADIKTGEIDIMLSWVEAHKDHVNYINADAVSGSDACLKLVKDYVRDEGTPHEKHFRLV